MDRCRLVVLSNPVDGREDEFNEWYDNQHIPDLLRVPGVVAAQRFRLSGEQLAKAPHPWRYLAVYEIEGADPGTIATMLRERAGTNALRPSEAIAPYRLSWIFEPITERVTAPDVSRQG